VGGVQTGAVAGRGYSYGVVMTSTRKSVARNSLIAYPPGDIREYSTRRARDWGLSLGEARRTRDDQLAMAADHRREAAAARLRAAATQWPRVLTTMREVIERYNAGAGRPSITVMAQPHSEHPGTTFESAGRSLHVRCEDGEMCVEVSGAPGPRPVARWIDFSRSPAATAAYILRQWMETL
jgi:hypothetical protein